MKPYYAAGGLNVELNTLRTEVSAARLVQGDADLLLDFAREAGGPVLELGCGDGRLLFPMARAGIDVTGIDISDGMLERAKRLNSDESPEVAARVNLVRTDMTDFDLGQKFSFAFCVFRAFNFIPTQTGQRACLVALRRHLEPGARFVLDVFDPPLPSIKPGSSGEHVPRLAEVHWHPETKHEVFIEIRDLDLDVVGQVLRETWRFTERDGQGITTRQEQELLTMRWLYRWETRYLLELCGFEVEAEYSDYFGSPPAYGREQIFVARAV